MRWGRPVAAALVVLGLLVGAQLAFTDVGILHSPEWHDPVEVASVADAGGELTDPDVAGDAGGGVVAWIAERSGTWRVEAAEIAVTRDGVSVGDRWTVARSSTPLAGVDVAVRGDRVALAWERAATNEVVYDRRGEDRRTVVSAGAARVGQPSVDWTADGAAVAWQFYDAGRSGVRLAAVAEGGVSRATVGGPTGGEGAPVVAASGADVAVVWLDADRDAVAVTGVGTDGGVAVGETTVLGPARPGGGMGAATAIGVAGARNDTAVRAAWTHGAAIDTGTVARAPGADRVASRVRRVGDGRRPAVAVGGDRWLAVWLYRSRTTGWDVAVHLAGDGVASEGTLSGLSSNANHPRAAFAPGPAVVWTERADGTRLLASGYAGPGTAGPGERLRADPGRFLFVALAAGVVGVVTTPIMPWSFLALLGGFVASSRVVTLAVATATAGVTGRLGGPADAHALRERLRSGPAMLYGVAFAVAQAAIAVSLITDNPTARTVGFSDPVGVAVAGFVAAVLLYRALDLDSAWRFAVLSTVTLNAALWTTGMAVFL